MHKGVKKPHSWISLITTPISNGLNRLFWVLILLVLAAGMAAASMHAAMAVDDQYLKALESEADDTGSVPKNPSKGKSSNVENSARADFEKLLEFELPSTYKFYAKLNANDQVKVIKLYNKEKKMSAASKLIFDLYFESNK